MAHGRLRNPNLHLSRPSCLHFLHKLTEDCCCSTIARSSFLPLQSATLEGRERGEMGREKRTKKKRKTEINLDLLPIETKQSSQTQLILDSTLNITCSRVFLQRVFLHVFPHTYT